MSLLIRGGTVVLPSGPVRADVLCTGERIQALIEHGEQTAAEEVVDASGTLVFPGFIDPHVHSRDPGAVHKEDFYHSTLGALAGGITTVLEMPNAVPPVTDARVFEERARTHEQSAWVDFGLWGLALGAENLADLPALFECGAVAVKLFWGYALDRETKQLVYSMSAHDGDVIEPPDNGDVYQIFETVATSGGLLGVHCEDRGVLRAADARVNKPLVGYDDLLRTRPAAAESAAIALGAEFSRATGCRFHVVHMSSKDGVEAVRAAQQRGIAVTAETCPHYLTLTDASYERIGPIMKVFPPVRSREHQEALWTAVQDGVIASVGSDHAPHTVEERSLPLDSQPAGMVGVETLGPLLVNEMVKGRITPQQLAALVSETTARLYGIYPRKGAILPGVDADLTIVDPNAQTSISNTTLHAKNPLSSWDGVVTAGRIAATVCRGSLRMKDGEILGEPAGRLVRSDHAAEPVTLASHATTSRGEE
jgi:allantoinase